MEKNLYIDASHPNETRIVLKSENSIEEYEFEHKNNLNFKNNIYLGTISRVEPSLQAAFVDFGRERHGFLAFNDIQSDYYQIPSEDKEKLKIAEEKIRENLKNKTIESSQESTQNNSLQIEEDNSKEEINGNVKNDEIKKNEIFHRNPIDVQGVAGHAEKVYQPKVWKKSGRRSLHPIPANFDTLIPV